MLNCLGRYTTCIWKHKTNKNVEKQKFKKKANKIVFESKTRIFVQKAFKTKVTNGMAELSFIWEKL